MTDSMNFSYFMPICGTCRIPGVVLICSFNAEGDFISLAACRECERFFTAGIPMALVQNAIRSAMESETQFDDNDLVRALYNVWMERANIIDVILEEDEEEPEEEDPWEV